MAETAAPILKDRAWLEEPRLREVMTVLTANGAETRIAGGAVRNAILGEPIADVDLATTLKPEEVMTRASEASFGVHPTGLAHGTVTIVNGGRPFEVTTLRHDVETDGRRARVAFTAGWQEDALRRDFTMNALYCDLEGKIFDYAAGYKDALARRVKFVGAPQSRIREDHLRILRFFRFHARYGKGAMDRQGLAACIRLRKSLATLSAERIRQELMKLLVAPRAVETLKVMAKHGILAVILPHTTAWRVLGRLPPDAILRLFVLAQETETLRDRLRLSNEEARRLRALSEAPLVTPAFREPERRRLLYHLGPFAWRDAVHLAWAQGRAREWSGDWSALLELPDRWAVPLFPVNGNDLKSIGLASGPALGETLRKLEDWWIASDFKPGRDELLSRARTMGTDNA